MILPQASGGSTDIVARVIGQQLSEKLGQQVVIDNRGGGGGNIAAGLVAKAAPDGYTVLQAGAPFVINASLYKTIPYDPVRDFVPVSLIAKAPQVLTVNSSSPAQNLKQLVALAKLHPGKLTYASAGSGTSNHLVGELFKNAAQIDMIHVPYKGGGQQLIALLGGEVDMIITSPLTVFNHVKDGRLRALAVSTAKRSPALSDTPTMIESGFPGFDVSTFYCVVAPAGTPALVVEKLRSALVEAIKNPNVQKRLQDEGAIPESSTSQELGTFIRSQIVTWERAVKISGAKAD
jgi:tripartite-type tricarboxylate transporter receptor subunit TctC